jgi:hypothetical protein
VWRTKTENDKELSMKKKRTIEKIDRERKCKVITQIKQTYTERERKNEKEAVKMKGRIDGERDEETDRGND